LEPAKVPCGSINNIGEALADPQAQARGAVVAMGHPLAPDLRLIASPMKLSATPVQYRRAPPLLGQHSRELLLEAGCSEAEISAWLASGVIA
jgi:crotonobetainyl-CoA:carnitine CoA-transferase CaiB-like acyl-CoA transferase